MARDAKEDNKESSQADREVMLTELASLQEERRFVFHRYMEALGIYLAIVGFTGGKYFEATPDVRFFLLGFLSLVNALGWLGARQFRGLAYHGITRENILSDRLGVQRPYPLLWGYWYALILGAAVQLGVVTALAAALGWFGA